MDLTDTILPKSDQLDAVDLLAGPRTFTIVSVSAGSTEQPVNIKLADFPRWWRPSKSMRRVLVAAWGVNGAAYAGKRLTLFCDPTIMFGGIEVGGTRISHMSDISAPLKIALLIKRGKSEVYVVQPLVEDGAKSVLDEGVDKVSMATPEQIELIGNLLIKVEINGRDNALSYIADIIGRKVESRAELTRVEASRVLDRLSSYEAQLSGE